MSTEHQKKHLPKKAAIVGCPFNGGQPRVGVEDGPIRLLETGLVDALGALGWDVIFDGLKDFEPLRPPIDPPIGIIKNPRFVSAVTQFVSEAVASHVRRGEVAVSLGGDHSLGMGTVSGTFSVHPNACLIWVDAHGDINTPDTTISGNMHGMPVSFLMGLGTKLPEFAWLQPLVKTDRIVYIGLRDLDPGEKVIIRENNIKAFTMHEVDKYGIGQVVDMALDHVNLYRDRPIHVSFDVDSLDPIYTPSTGTAVRGGLTYREAHYVCEALHKTGLIAAFDLVEVNPSIGTPADAQQTIDIGASLIRAALGETLL